MTRFHLRRDAACLGINMMAKERKRGNREAKKPKQAPKPAAAAPAVFAKGLSPDIGKSKKT